MSPCSGRSEGRREKSKVQSPQIIFQHYRELVRPKAAKSWFSITPGEDGKIVYIEVPKEADQPEAKAAKQAAAQVA